MLLTVIIVIKWGLQFNPLQYVTECLDSCSVFPKVSNGRQLFCYLPTQVTLNTSMEILLLSSICDGFT